MTGAFQMDLEQNKKHTLWFIVASLLAHALIMGALSFNTWWTNHQAQNKSTALDVDVVPISKQDLEKLKGQIVETAQTQKSEKVAKDAFLGQQTQIVDRQTRAAKTAAFQDGKTGGAQSKEQGSREKMALGDLGVKMDFKPMGNLGPGQVSSTSDYLKDVQQGAQTLLNTKEFAYFSFYQRVRKQLEQYWEPGLRQRLKSMFERGRQLAADREHSTHLTVVMNAEGTITRILVQNTSGFMDLDQAAIDAFNKAGPFPNPPQGMIERDGTVKIEWEFVLKT